MHVWMCAYAIALALDSQFSIHHVGPNIQTQVLGVGGKHFNLWK